MGLLSNYLPLKHPQIISAFLLFLASCASYQGPQHYKVSEEFFYTTAESQRQLARAYVPRGQGPFPGVILVHGGSWSSRSYEDMRFIAKTLATHGFTVMSINYRLAPAHHHPAPVEDLEKALVYFRNHHERFKLDSERLGLWGYSAGAHIVAQYALTKAKAPPLRVSAVVAGGGPFNLRDASDNSAVKRYMGFEKSADPNAYVESSPQFRVTPEAPPFFLYHALRDQEVLHHRSTDFEAELRSHGVPVERLDIHCLGHVTTFLFSYEAHKQGLRFLERELGSGK